VQNPVRAKTIDEIEDALEEWDSNVTRYILAGGPEMPESEKAGVALRVMPLTVDHSMIRDLRKSADYETLKDNLTEEVNFMREHRRGPSLDKAPAGVVDDDEGQGENDDADEDEEAEETMDPMMVAALLQAVGDNQEAQQQVLALAAGNFQKVGNR
jgi:hypothetical protein